MQELKHPERLVALKEHLLKNVINAKHPKVHFDMQEWCYRTKGSEEKFGEPEWKPYDHELIPKDICGTAACLAGHLVIIHYERPELVPVRDWEEMAGELLFDLMIRTCELFHIQDWPDNIETQYERAETDRGRARAALRAIDWFLEKHGFGKDGKRKVGGRAK